MTTVSQSFQWFASSCWTSSSAWTGCCPVLLPFMATNRITQSGQRAATCWCTALIIFACCPLAPIVHVVFWNLTGCASRTRWVLLAALLLSNFLGATHTWLTRQIDFRTVMGWALSIVEDRFARRFTTLIISTCCPLAPIVHAMFCNLMGFASRTRWVLLAALLLSSFLGASHTRLTRQMDFRTVMGWALSIAEDRFARRCTTLIISTCCRLAPIIHVAFCNLVGFTSRARWVLLTALVHRSCLGATNTGCVLQVHTR